MTDTRTVDDESQDDVLDLDEDQIVDGDTDAADDEPQDEPEEEFLSFGDDDQEPEPESDLVKHLRRENRKLYQQVSEARRQQTPAAEEPIVVGDRPKIEDFDYDSEKFDEAFDAWEQRREQKRQQEQRNEQAQQQQQQRWQQVQDGYNAKKTALPFADKDQAEATAFSELSDVQQAVIASVADNPALVIYAAGKNPARLAELAALDDPLKLARLIGKMESTMTVKKRARAPEPDRPIRGSSITVGSTDKELEKLEREAERTGNRDKVIAFKRSIREKTK